MHGLTGAGVVALVVAGQPGGCDHISKLREIWNQIVRRACTETSMHDRLHLRTAVGEE